MDQSGFRDRVDALLARVDLVSLVAAAVPLSRGRNPRGKCPFHGSKSDSLAVYPESGRFRCWGCGEGGDAIKFVELMYGLTFVQAMEQLEAQHGVDGLTALPAKREKRVQRATGREPISSAEMGRVLWAEAKWEPEPIRLYLRSRGIPEPMLTDDVGFLGGLRFHPAAQIAAWHPGARERTAVAPAMIAMVRELPTLAPQAFHITYLAPDLTGKMVRVDGRGESLPARKFLGSVAGAGAVFSPRGANIAASAPIFVAEGIETLLSGMALLDAPPEAVGLALLSLDNLQGGWLGVGKRRALALYDPQPDPARPPVCFAHEAMVVGLIDADMKPVPVRLIEHAGGPVVERKLSPSERSQLCAALFARSWRAAGSRRVQTVRPPMGRDFNDVTAGRSPQSFREAVG